MCALHIDDKSSKYMCALGISAPVAELEVESITHTQNFRVIKDMPEQPRLLCRAPSDTRGQHRIPDAGHLHLSGMVISLKSSMKNLKSRYLIRNYHLFQAKKSILLATLCSRVCFD